MKKIIFPFIVFFTLFSFVFISCNSFQLPVDSVFLSHDSSPDKNTNNSFQPVSQSKTTKINWKEAKETLLQWIATVESLQDSLYSEESLSILKRQIQFFKTHIDFFKPQELISIIDSIESSFSLLKIKTGALPRIYISTHNNQTPTKDSYISTHFIITDKEGGSYGTYETQEAQIAVRGNSTSGAIKKPYNIKLPKSVSLLGMDKGKKWCLMAEHFDKTLMRNHTVLSFAQQIGLANTPESTYVDVYFNSEYVGVYLLTTPVSDGRLDLDKYENSYLLELENSRIEKDKYYYTTPIMSIRTLVKYPENMTTSDESKLISFFNQFESNLKTRKLKNYERFIDVDAFVDFYIVHEYFKPVDFGYSSVNFVLIDGKLSPGPVWDFDLSSGNVSHTINQESYKVYNNVSEHDGNHSGDSAQGLWCNIGWFYYLLQTPEFLELVKERYQELQPYITNLYEENELGDSFLNKTYQKYVLAFENNYFKCGYPLIYVNSLYERSFPDDTYQENYEYFKEWLKRRNEWLCEEWQIN